MAPGRLHGAKCWWHRGFQHCSPSPQRLVGVHPLRVGILMEISDSGTICLAKSLLFLFVSCELRFAKQPVLICGLWLVAEGFCSSYVTNMLWEPPMSDVTHRAQCLPSPCLLLTFLGQAGHLWQGSGSCARRASLAFQGLGTQSMQSPSVHYSKRCGYVCCELHQVWVTVLDLHKVGCGAH